MKRKIIAGLIGIITILVAVLFAGCIEKEAPSPNPTLSPTPSPMPVPTPTLTPTPTSTPIPTPVTPTVHDIGEITISPTTQPTGTIARHYEWSYGGGTWTGNLTVPKSLYEYYKDKPRPPTGDYSVYITDPYDDAYIEALIEKFNEAAAKQGYDEYEKINLVIAFVQSLPYTVDNVTTPFDEYPRYPIETLVDNGGDCEDASILTAALIDKMTYDVVLIKLPGHVAVGVLGGEGIYGTYYSENGKKYFYLEATGEGWKIGEIPTEYKGSSATLFHLVPRAVLTHDWTATHTRSIRTDIVTLTVTVENVGTATANNVKVYAGFDAGEDYVYNPKESGAFNLNPGPKVTVTLYLNVPRDKYTRLIVRTISDNYLMDESTSEWFQT
ncbi:MAG: hypothetical protein QMD22_08555 [archaeon]|nr:hypothetical protein [archaeon]